MMKKQRKKGENFLKKKYSQSWNYIKESKNFIYSIIGVFFLFSIIGFFFPAPEYVSEYISKFIQELLEKTQNMSGFELTRFIFFNNLQSSFFGMVFGVLFGIFPLVNSVMNGYLLGFVASASVESRGVFVLWKIFPHGIFELPAIFISLGFGLKIGAFVFQKNKIKSLKVYISKSIIAFIFIVIPLLITAAIIEGILIFFFG